MFIRNHEKIKAHVTTGLWGRLGFMESVKLRATRKKGLCVSIHTTNSFYSWKYTYTVLNIVLHLFYTFIAYLRAAKLSTITRIKVHYINYGGKINESLNSIW